jgi:exonuclease 3'-5' domain-containing protein 1
MNDPEVEVVDTTEHIVRLVDRIIEPSAFSPILFIDLEGVKLSRHGSISILTLLVGHDSLQRVYLVDVHALNALAFSTAGTKNITLKDILEAQQIIKVFFDVRNDSDALFAHFGIALKSVEDVQVMESATRTTTASRRFLSGLATCIENNLSDSSNCQKLARWKLTKTNGERLFKPELGGSYDVFNRRPIPKEIIQYCAGDVQYLESLRSFFLCKIDRNQHLVDEESRARVAASQKLGYQPHGQHKAMAPWTKEQNDFLDRISCPQNTYSRRNALDFDDDFDNIDPFDDCEPDYDDWDEGSTSCRDIINDCDMHYYYSD